MAEANDASEVVTEPQQDSQGVLSQLGRFRPANQDQSGVEGLEGLALPLDRPRILR
jgi:hypothetical protein